MYTYALTDSLHATSYVLTLLQVVIGMYFILQVLSPPTNMNYDSNNVEQLDGINSNRIARRAWISIAQKHDVHARAFNFLAPVDLCLHNDTVRALGGPLVCSFLKRYCFSFLAE
jgi:hypothetical protein